MTEQVLAIRPNGGGILTPPPFTIEIPPKKKKWIMKWHVFGLFFAISNGRLKKRDERRYKGGWSSYRENREELFEQQGHRCPHCGYEGKTFKDLESHHILPWSRFPELRDKRDNIILLCHRCHKEVHCNPYLNIQMMDAKAKELGIELKERYDYAKEDRSIPWYSDCKDL